MNELALFPGNKRPYQEYIILQKQPCLSPTLKSSWHFRSTHAQSYDTYVKGTQMAKDLLHREA